MSEAVAQPTTDNVDRKLVCQLKQNKRIFISNVNGLLGHSLFEHMRNDHIAIKSDGQQVAHRFLGTLNAVPAGGMVTPSPSDTIKIVDSQAKPKTFVKQIRGSDIIILDISQFSANLEEAEKAIHALKYQEEGVKAEKEQTLIVVTSAMSWSNTAASSSAYTDQDYARRVPLPKYSGLKQVEQAALSLTKSNNKINVHIVCSGFLYGNGEQNDIFYEFFRRAWVSLHPDLAALPVINGGKNCLPTIHVDDLANCIDILCMQEQHYDKYLIAVDSCAKSTQKDIVTAITEGIGSGATKEVSVADVVDEAWCEFLTVDVKLEVSACFKDAFEWKCKSGISKESMKMLNDEFNYFRGLFPLKVMISGPPCSGKTYSAHQLSEEYGIPHITIKDVIDMGMQLKTEYGQQLKLKIEELKDLAEAEYEKTRKKKDPDFDRDACQPKLTDDILIDLVKIQLNSAACMNKGFILDGFPRSPEDAKQIFYNKVEVPKEPVEGEEEEAEPQYEYQLNDKVIPQYAIQLEGEDAALMEKAKNLPPEQTAGTHHDEAGMARRLKEYRARNTDDSNLKEFFTEAIGYQNVLVIDSAQPGPEQLVKMREIIEQKGKPCCINMITEEDKKFLLGLKKAAEKEARAKARAEAAALAAEQEVAEPAEGEEEQKAPVEIESEEEVDELTVLIQNEERETAERLAAEEIRKKADASELEQRKAKEAKEAIKLEKLRDQERDLLDQRSQPIRQYLMDNVVPHLTEGLIDLCKTIPDDPTDYLANFLLAKADEIDEKIIKEREEAAAAKLEAKKLKF